MGTLSMRLDDELEGKLARAVELERKSRSEVVRDALLTYLEERERRRFLDEIARAARELNPAEARSIAEEALPADNEALGVAEPRARYSAARKGKARKQ